MREYYEKWKKLELHFDGIYTGFLGSVRQVGIVEGFIEEFADRDTRIIVDPVMGDNGRRYATIGDNLCREIRKLLPLSSIITPNLTEACLLAGIEYREIGADEEELRALAVKLSRCGAGNIVITGISDGNDICDFVWQENGRYELLRQPCTGSAHAGTGDVFASIIAADAVNGVDFPDSVKRAASFVGRAIALSDMMEVPSQDGVCFEEILGELAK